MNSLLTVTETLALLERLKTVARDFAAREEKLNGDHDVQIAAAQNQISARQQKLEADAETELQNAAAGFEIAKHAAQAKMEKRNARLSEVQFSLTDRISQKIGGDDREWNETTQLALMEMEKTRDENLSHVAEVQNEFQTNLDAAETNLSDLKTQARRAFRGYFTFRRWLNSALNLAAKNLANLSGDHSELYEQFENLQKKIVGDLTRFKKMPLLFIFRFIPIWLIAILSPVSVGVGQIILNYFDRRDISGLYMVIVVIVFLAILVIYFIGARNASPLAKTIAENLSKAEQLISAAREKSAAYFEKENARVKNQFETSKSTLTRDWRQALRGLGSQRDTWLKVIEEKSFRAQKRIKKWHDDELVRLEQQHKENVSRLKKEDLERVQRANSAHEELVKKTESDFAQNWRQLETDWKNMIQPMCEQIRAVNETAAKNFPDWNAAETASPSPEFQNRAKFGRLEIVAREFFQTLPQDKRLAWPGPEMFSLPLTLICPQQGSILFEGGKTGGEEAFDAINNIIFRLLADTPPGRLSFTIFDPVGLGQNFATLMHLADYEESFINSRIWTQTSQFEEKLSELNEHMEKIIQMYLRNEYATIAEYNAAAGSVAEKFHFLVIASFPVNFNESAARKLRNIAASGARCGVHTLIHWDQRNALPQDFVPDELRQNSVGLTHNGKNFELTNWRAPGVKLILDSPPPAEFATQFLQRIGESNKDATRVEVPFQQIAPTENEIWREETTELLRVPIGRASATKLQFLEIGSGTRQHALIAGKTGSGKSTLFHIIITNLSLRCSPEQVEFYLVDFKKGVEFKCYASRHLPHARVVAIESDREFGLSVLQRVDEELRRRGDLFRKLGAQDLAGYKRAGGTEAMPRTLLMIDEFQEFFVEEDHISQGAAMLLDRIVRQGRAFGIHVILGSQTLGGAYTLARATLGQMVIRIALQCNEADAMLIMDQDNPAPRLLSRPGEGIYNDTAGAIEGNSPFQAVWLSDRERDSYLAEIRERADKIDGHRYPGPIVFEGNAPADVEENHLLRDALISGSGFQPDQTGKMPVPLSAHVWLGAPNSIKGPTDAVFRRQSGSNLLVVAQNEERTATIVSVAMISLAAQFPKNGARFILFDATPPDSPQRELLDRTVQSLQSAPYEIVRANNANLSEVINSLAEELKSRSENETGGSNAEIFVLINGLQNFKKLRVEDEYSFSTDENLSPAKILTSLISEGPARGIHLLVTCDTYNNVSRFLGRKLLTEFEMRVVFQMSATDSASLVDSPNAATLGLHRALYHNDRESRLETFRPYAAPEKAWVEFAAGQLAKRR